jgi:peptidoglycan/xylan/chitin deacetylase (PgdA/CDA1 family)
MQLRPELPNPPRSHAAPAPGLQWVPRLAWAAGRSGVIVNEHTLGREGTFQLVDVLHRWFDFISLEELPARLESPGRRPFCLLTFDDGKKSNASVTAPLLHSLGVPAVFYVVTDYVSQVEPLWVDVYHALVRKVGEPPGLESGTVKQLPHSTRMQRLEKEVRLHGVSLPVSEDVQAMSWDDARRLAAQGFAIGAHGVTHAILTREAREEALREIEASLARVSIELGGRCDTFAFPNGNCDAELCRYAEARGATTVMSTVPTWVGRQSPLWRLPRVQLYASSSCTSG